MRARSHAIRHYMFIFSPLTPPAPLTLPLILLMLRHFADASAMPLLSRVLSPPMMPLTICCAVCLRATLFHAAITLPAADTDAAAIRLFLPRYAMLPYRVLTMMPPAALFDAADDAACFRC